MFREQYANVFEGDERWKALEAPTSDLYTWSEESTYVKNPPFFEGMTLQPPGVEQKDFNSYGARRGNHEVMMRGTFANIRLRNQLGSGRDPLPEGGVTRHLPDGEQMTIYDAAMRYARENTPLVVLAGEAERGAVLAAEELERQDAHADQVAAVDALEALGQRGAHALQLRALGRPVA